MWKSCRVGLNRRDTLHLTQFQTSRPSVQALQGPRGRRQAARRRRALRRRPAGVLSVDEKSQIHVPGCTQPGLPMKKDRAGTMTPDCTARDDELMILTAA